MRDPMNQYAPRRVDPEPTSENGTDPRDADIIRRLFARSEEGLVPLADTLRAPLPPYRPESARKP